MPLRGQTALNLQGEIFEYATYYISSFDISTGALMLTKIDNMNGEETFRITATDNGTPSLSSDVDFTINVAAVNDPVEATEDHVDCVLEVDYTESDILGSVDFSACFVDVDLEDSDDGEDQHHY